MFSNIRLALILLLTLGCLLYCILWMRLPLRSTPFVNTNTRSFHNDAQFNGVHEISWIALHAPLEKSGIPVNSANEKYRLAGTFFSFDDNSGRTIRTAIIDQITTGEQLVIQEHGYLNDYQIVGIERDRVFLKNGDVEGVLLISFHDKGQELITENRTEINLDLVPNDSALARQIGENRWILNRKTLMDYYSELLDDPERIASIYISLKPDYNEKNKIAGYELDMVGEKSFFRDMGLQQGDRIRKVNSMNMTSQTRGEYFLKEFVNNRLSAIVLDIERDNVPKKMIYLVR